MKWVKRAMLIAAVLCCVCGAALAEGLWAHVPVTGGTADVSASVVDGETWFLLPSFASEDTVTYTLDGKPVRPDDEALAGANVMISQNLRALFLFSADPVNQGRTYIDGSADRSAWTTGSVVMVGENGAVDHTAGIEVLRGRGNSTWAVEKKPYHLKLDARTDLLDIGQPSRKWVLLADAIDGTLIRNLMTLDLARELGIESTPHTEHIDLYYDGEYRGTYLLCEKVEVGEFGVDELDYDELMKRLNRTVGIHDLDALPVASAANRFGNQLFFTDGMVETTLPTSGAYFVETEGSATPNDRCWFYLSDGSAYALKNPENATARMLTYISERLQEARETLVYGGVNPENGRTAAEDFDVDGFARVALLHELAYNPDSYERSSFFVLPAGETRFETGPIWDFDLSWRYRTNLANANGHELQKMEGWLPDFYGVDAVWTKMGEIWQEELYPLVRDVLLGSQQGEHLRSIDAYAAHIEASRCMNDVIWDTHELSRLVYGADYEEEIELLKSYLTERSDWFGTQLETRTADPEKVDVRIQAEFMAFGDYLTVEAYPWSRAEVVWFDRWQVSEATEEDYAVWQVDMAIRPAPGHAFETPVITVNGVEAEGQLTEDGLVRVSVYAQDLSYRPADYYGEDMGMVFNCDYYAEAHPDIAEECEYDPQLLLEYFCDEGMYEGHMGNAFFDPVEVGRKNPYLLEMLGEDWWTYYTEFIYYGYEEGWLKDGKTFLPPVETK